MNQQKLIGIIIFMLILVGIIAAVNHYYLQPKVLLTLPGVEKLNLPGKTRESFKPDLYAGTMEKILSEQGQQAADSQLVATVQRNPFLWLEESTDPVATPEGPGKLPADKIPETPGTETPGVKTDLLPGTATAPESMAPEFTLTMVIVGEASNLALVNNHFVSEGSQIQGYKVVKIEPQTIVLDSKGHQKTITLEPSGGPLQYRKASEKKKTLEKQSPVSTPLDFQTQLKQVLKLYSDPNLILK